MVTMTEPLRCSQQIPPKDFPSSGTNEQQSTLRRKDPGADAFDAVVQAANPSHPDHAAWVEEYGNSLPRRTRASDAVAAAAAAANPDTSLEAGPSSRDTSFMTPSKASVRLRANTLGSRSGKKAERDMSSPSLRRNRGQRGRSDSNKGELSIHPAVTIPPRRFEQGIETRIGGEEGKVSMIAAAAAEAVIADKGEEERKQQKEFASVAENEAREVVEETVMPKEDTENQKTPSERGRRRKKKRADNDDKKGKAKAIAPPIPPPRFSSTKYAHEASNSPSIPQYPSSSKSTYHTTHSRLQSSESNSQHLSTLDSTPSHPKMTSHLLQKPESGLKSADISAHAVAAQTNAQNSSSIALTFNPSPSQISSRPPASTISGAREGARVRNTSVVTMDPSQLGPRFSSAAPSATEPSTRSSFSVESTADKAVNFSLPSEDLHKRRISNERLSVMRKGLVLFASPFRAGRAKTSRVDSGAEPIYSASRSDTQALYSETQERRGAGPARKSIDILSGSPSASKPSILRNANTALQHHQARSSSIRRRPSNIEDIQETDHPAAEPQVGRARSVRSVFTATKAAEKEEEEVDLQARGTSLQNGHSRTVSRPNGKRSEEEDSEDFFDAKSDEGDDGETDEEKKSGGTIVSNRSARRNYKRRSLDSLNVARAARIFAGEEVKKQRLPIPVPGYVSKTTTSSSPDDDDDEDKQAATPKVTSQDSRVTASARRTRSRAPQPLLWGSDQGNLTGIVGAPSDARDPPLDRQRGQVREVGMNIPRASSSTSLNSKATETEEGRRQLFDANTYYIPPKFPRASSTSFNSADREVNLATGIGHTSPSNSFKSHSSRARSPKSIKDASAGVLPIVPVLESPSDLTRTDKSRLSATGAESAPYIRDEHASKPLRVFPRTPSQVSDITSTGTRSFGRTSGRTLTGVLGKVHRHGVSTRTRSEQELTTAIQGGGRNSFQRDFDSNASVALKMSPGICTSSSTPLGFGFESSPTTPSIAGSLSWRSRVTSFTSKKQSQDGGRRPLLSQVESLPARALASQEDLQPDDGWKRDLLSEAVGLSLTSRPECAQNIASQGSLHLQQGEKVVRKGGTRKLFGKTSQPVTPTLSAHETEMEGQVTGTIRKTLSPALLTSATHEADEVASFVGSDADETDRAAEGENVHSLNTSQKAVNDVAPICESVDDHMMRVELIRPSIEGQSPVTHDLPVWEDEGTLQLADSLEAAKGRSFCLRQVEVAGNCPKTTKRAARPPDLDLSVSLKSQSPSSAIFNQQAFKSVPTSSNASHFNSRTPTRVGAESSPSANDASTCIPFTSVTTPGSAGRTSFALDRDRSPVISSNFANSRFSSSSISLISSSKAPKLLSIFRRGRSRDEPAHEPMVSAPLAPQLLCHTHASVTCGDEAQSADNDEAVEVLSPANTSLEAAQRARRMLALPTDSSGMTASAISGRVTSSTSAGLPSSLPHSPQSQRDAKAQPEALPTIANLDGSKGSMSSSAISNMTSRQTNSRATAAVERTPAQRPQDHQEQISGRSSTSLAPLESASMLDESSATQSIEDPPSPSPEINAFGKMLKASAEADAARIKGIARRNQHFQQQQQADVSDEKDGSVS